MSQLFGASLASTHFNDVNLTHADLVRVKATAAVLENVEAMGSNWHEANLSHVRMHLTDMSAAGFGGASLERAYLSHVNFQTARLRNANLSYINQDSEFSPQKPYEGVDFRGADLHEAQLYRARLMHAVLVGSILSGADLRKAHIGEADFRGCDLTDADLRGVIGVSMALGLEYAVFDHTKIWKSQAEIWRALTEPHHKRDRFTLCTYQR